MVFAHTLLAELGEWCQVSTARDWKTISGRVEHEGLSFLTITLPDFGKSFEKSLDHRQLLPSFFSPTWGFKGGVPRFLGGFLELVFDAQSGALLDEPNIATIRAVRQFSLAFGKIGVPCSDERVQTAIQKYIQCEREVRVSDSRLQLSDKLEFVAMATRLWSDPLSELDNRVFEGSSRLYESSNDQTRKRGILPKHGPGATADKLMGNQKFVNQTWTTRLEEFFPFNEWSQASWSQYSDLSDVNFLEPGSEIPVKVITVPKTLKTPRIIAIEPTCMQYMQQAIQEAMKEEFRRFDNPRNFICYDSQEPNRLMARKGSHDGTLATLDLSEASDRVSNEHVRLLLSNFPHLARGVDATRSRKALVDGKVIRLAKFASMGSALCFPMESLVFCTVVFLGIQKSLGRRLTIKDIKSFYGRVRVYGDDIVVPVVYASSVIEQLETFGFKVNTDKSFWTGKFRESCGGDYYDGYDVSVVRVRSMLPNNRTDKSELVKTVALRNHLSEAGFTKVVGFLDDLISSMIPFPKVLSTSPILGRIDPDGLFQTDKTDPNLHHPLVKGVVVSAVVPVNSIDGYAALLKHFLKRGDEPFAEKNHLHRSGRPIAVDIKRRYARPY
jgi:hypothetical protein